MLEEGSGAMEKKVSTRQPPGGQSRNGSVTSERKSDFTPNRRGYGRRPSSNGGVKTQDVTQAPRPIPIQKWDRSFGDRRQRQRNYYDSSRQCEEVVESDDVYDVVSTSSRKGNANHLLNFKFYPRQSQLEEHRWCDRSSVGTRGRRGGRKTTRYKKEQFLQASCQFVVRNTGEYAEQAFNPDALVDWNMIELIRSYSTEPVNCPICLQVPSAGKITKCGHTYCWACILHYLKLGEKDMRKCPICYDTVELQDLKSVQWIDVPEYKVGDELKMKLMRKSKGSVFVAPKRQWEDRQGKPMNVGEGAATKYMKLLVASCDQIQTDVIDKERSDLTIQLEDAEESETCFIQMALEFLQARELSLQHVFQQKMDNKVSIPGMNYSEGKEKEKSCEKNDARSYSTPTVYADAFEDQTEERAVDSATDLTQEVDNGESVVDTAAVFIDLSASTDDSPRQRNDSECSLPFGSPPCPFPLLPDQELNPVPLSLEETAEHLELPMDLNRTTRQPSKKITSLNYGDNYFFYQACTGQHIYLNSLNAQCLAREYGSLEEGPDSITGTVVAIERIFMTEDVRKRLRYLGHIPLTCEFHVVELKLKPPTVSKETLKSFEGAFEKKRKLRQQKAREEKRRAKKFEVEHKKTFGIYPEIQIPLDNLNQFPSHLLSTSNNSMEEYSVEGLASPSSPSPSDVGPTQAENVLDLRHRNDSTSDESLSGSMSFAQMLKAGKTSQAGAWGRSGVANTSTVSSSSDLAPVVKSKQRDENDSDGEGLPAPSYSESMSDAIAKALDGISLRRQSADNATTPHSTPGGRKKRKEKQILFSTAMARKN